MDVDHSEIFRCNKKVVGQRITDGSTTKMNTRSVVSQSVQLNELNKKNNCEYALSLHPLKNRICFCLFPF